MEEDENDEEDEDDEDDEDGDDENESEEDEAANVDEEGDMMEEPDDADGEGNLYVAEGWGATDLDLDYTNSDTAMEMHLEELHAGDQLLSASQQTSYAQSRTLDFDGGFWSSENSSSSVEQEPVDIFPFNFLQTSVSDINLFCDIDKHRIGRNEFFASGPSRDRSKYHNGNRQYPYYHVVSSQLLHQQIPPGLPHPAGLERMNMIIQIPELNIVIIGNQIGRVGILTMTKWAEKNVHGYRLECILPFKSQEEKAMRPNMPLMGIATSPIHGQQEPPEAGSPADMAGESEGWPSITTYPRRFRLMIFYCNHRILSYELSRPTEDILVV